MKDYIKQEKNKRLKGYLLSIIFILLVFIVLILMYYIYFSIDINEVKSVEKSSNIGITEKQAEEKDKTITQVLEDVNKTVVGISKIKEAGDSVFLENGVSKGGLGTGIIVSQNGYI